MGQPRPRGLDGPMARPTGGRPRAFARAWTYGAGTFFGTTSPPSVNLPSFTAITVTPFWGTCESAENVILPVMPGKSLVLSIADLTAAESVLPARLIASASR